MLAGAVAVLLHYTETYNTQHGYKYGQDLTFARVCNATSFGMVQM